MFTFVDLFSGIGGFRIPLEKAGGRCILSCEIDKYARKTYTENFKIDEPFLTDITRISSYSIPSFDVLVAGFPCQPFSMGNRANEKYLNKPISINDTRGTLFYDVARFIKTGYPKIFILENVKGLLSDDKGQTFAHMSSILMGLGYKISFGILSSESFVPQKRERLFIIGYSEDVRSTVSIKAIKNDQTFIQGPLLKTILENEIDPKYTLSDNLWQYLQNHKNKHESLGNSFGYSLVGPNDVTRTLTSRYYKDGSEILLAQKGKNPRKLTPTECKRLMGFPEDFKFPVSDTQAYKQLGNSVVVPLVEQIVNYVITPNFPKKRKELFSIDKSLEYGDYAIRTDARTIQWNEPQGHTIHTQEGAGNQDALNTLRNFLVDYPEDNVRQIGQNLVTDRPIQPMLTREDVQELDRMLDEVDIR